MCYTLEPGASLAFFPPHLSHTLSGVSGSVTGLHLGLLSNTVARQMEPPPEVQSPFSLREHSADVHKSINMCVYVNICLCSKVSVYHLHVDITQLYRFFNYTHIYIYDI